MLITAPVTPANGSVGTAAGSVMAVVAQVVARHAEGSKVNPQPGVEQHRIAADGVAGAAGHEHAGAAVEGDGIAGAGGGAADPVAGHAVEPHAVAAVAERGRAGDIGA